jgi:non-ribosomal peptide synthetase component F
VIDVCQFLSILIILADSQHQEASPAFLETLFDFITLSSKSDRLTLNGAHLESVSLQGIDQVAKFDFMCTLLHNPSTENNTMSCSFVCSRDLFDQMTVERIARRFQHLLTQLFCSNTMMNQFDQVHQPIYKLSLLLPEEVAELEQTMFQRCLNIGNAGMV